MKLYSLYNEYLETERPKEKLRRGRLSLFGPHRLMKIYYEEPIDFNIKYYMIF